MNEKLEDRLQRLAGTFERMRLDEYVEYATDRRRRFFDAFLLGALRGIGFTLGVAVLGAFVAVIIKNIVVENIPLIGGFLAEVVNAIQAKM